MTFRNAKKAAGAKLIAATALMVLASGALAPAATAGRAANYADGQTINVSVSFNSQRPMGEMDEAELSAMEEEGRRVLYRIAAGECEVLKSVIARTCRLTHINVNSQIQQHGNQPAPILYLNGNATFAITLKDDVAGNDNED